MLREQTADGTPDQASPPSSWAARYRERHRWRRVTDFPEGVSPPHRVRIYRRCEHYMLQWWSRSDKKNVAERVDGDFIAAIARAREIDERLDQLKSDGRGQRRLRHVDLVDAYKRDLERRADAGEIAPTTVDRYSAALEHYLGFVRDPKIESQYRFAASIDREFALAFSAFLARRSVPPNGHPHTAVQPLKSAGYVEDVVRAMFAWGADQSRGNVLPTTFQSPFSGRRRRPSHESVDPFGEPDITVNMAAEFLRTCDSFQLPLFALLALYGLRASEPAYTFCEHIRDGHLSVDSDESIGYFTKGRRNKRLPLLRCVERLLDASRPQGLLFVRRDVAMCRETPRLAGNSLDELRAEFAVRTQRTEQATARARRRIRDAILKEAGALNYGRIQHEFGRISKRLNWPTAATLKDFRHLFCSCMQNAGMPEMYRRYLMGHSLGRSAIVAYSHLNEVRLHYELAVSDTMAPIVEAVRVRSQQLGMAADDRQGGSGER